MAESQGQSGLPALLKKLGSMTAIRDTYLVEQSLLRTLGPLIGVLDTTLHRIDDDGTVVRTLKHTRVAVAGKNGGQQSSEKFEETTFGEQLSPETENLLESVRLLGKTCSRKFENELVTCYPVFGGNTICGYFLFRRDREVTPTEDAVVNGILEVFTNFYSLLETSQRDPLTGLLNRYSLESNLDRLWSLLLARLQTDANDKSTRKKVPHSYWLGVMDIDHFKRINDTYGHTIGDEVLILVTRLLETVFRKSDLLYRYGGEEFVAIIAADDSESATRVFERARQAIGSFVFPQVGQVTISTGFSGADPMVLPKEVINRADRSLYAAKDAGRNRVFYYDDLITQGFLKEVGTGSVDLF